MATLTVVTSDESGEVFTPASAAAGGDEFANTGKEIFYIQNGGGAPINVTFVTQSTVGGESFAVTDNVIAVANGTEQVIGPFPTAIYNDGDDKVQITYSAVTSVTVGVIKTVAVQ